MKVFKKTRKNLKTDNQTGFGTNASNYGGRFLAKDGSANIEKRGLPFFDQISWFHTLLRLPAWKFQLMIFLVLFSLILFLPPSIILLASNI
ncbi:Inward rectifier potassium channel Irk [Flavobacterium psychrophilum]|uniref:hypothetical protein n=1 Tax=Flavobacterium psychrophilum TaxID=96345 RepID=UPI00076ED5EC|nr:Inward rectifier potassium channel Irk [Flavobacterium psychrophilum]